MKIKVMLDPGAKMPTLAHEHDVGYDLYSREDIMILERGNHCFDTGGQHGRDGERQRWLRQQR